MTFVRYACVLSLASLALVLSAFRSDAQFTPCSGGSGPPTCDGTCPAGEDCIGDGGVCLCFPRCDPLVSDSPVCSGTCPAGFTCDVYVGCHCLPTCGTGSAVVCVVSDGESEGCQYPLECQVSGGSCACAAVASVCGNGMTERGEECEPLDDAACPGRCGVDCGCNRACGDGAQDPGEQCDDGNVTSGDGCSATCQDEVSVPGLALPAAMLLALLLLLLGLRAVRRFE
jgi:cysteine-rich repeat protein